MFKSFKKMGLVMAVFYMAIALNGCGGGGGGGGVTSTVLDTNTNVNTITVEDDKISLSMVDNSVKTSNKMWKPAETYVSKAVKSGVPFSKFLGLSGNSTYVSQSKAYRSPAVKAILPSRFSWRDRDGVNWNTSVKNQGYFGTCVGFATIAAVETQMRIKNNNPTQVIDLSELHVFFNGGGNFNYGWYFNPALDYLKTQGTVSENECPYSNAPGHNSTLCQNAFKVKITDYVVLSRGNSAIKSALMDGPVVTSMLVYQDFKYYTGSVYEHLANFVNNSGQTVTNSIAGSHAVLIVGYNDEQNCWYVKNSWGTEWGDDGYFRIKYDECNIGANDAFSVLMSEVPNQQHLIPVSNLELVSVTDSIARLKWGAVANALGYNIYINNNLFATVKEPVANISNLSPDTLYSVVVTAFDSIEETAKSNIVNVKTTNLEWKVESVNWIINYGNNYSDFRGYVTKSGASKIKVRFKEVRMEENCDFLNVVSTSEKLTGTLNSYITKEVNGDNLILSVNSDFENHYFFIIDQIIWQGNSSVSATKSGVLFETPVVNSKPILSNIKTSGNSGLIPISFSLNEADNDICSVKLFYSVDGGNTYMPTVSVTGQVSNLYAGDEKVIYWQSDFDIKENSNTVRVRLVANDGKTDSNVIDSSLFAVVNKVNANRPVVFNVKVDFDSDKFYISYDLSDVENDLSNVKVYYSVGSNSNYKLTSNVTGDLSNVAVGNGKIIIFSPKDKDFTFPTENDFRVFVKVVPCDNISDGNGSGNNVLVLKPYTPPVNIVPNISNVRLSSADNKINILYDVLEDGGSPISLKVFYSVNNNVSSREAFTLSGDLNNVTKGVNKSIVFNVLNDSPFDRDTVFFISLSAGNALGNMSSQYSRVSVTYIARNEVPIAKINSLEFAGRDIKIKYSLTDRECDDCTVDVYYSVGNNANYKKALYIEEVSPFPKDGATALSGFTSYFKFDKEVSTTSSCDLYIKLVPSDLKVGVSSESSINLPREFVYHAPALNFEYSSMSNNRVCVRGLITDKVSAKCKVEAFYSTDDETFFPINYNDASNYSLISSNDKASATYLEFSTGTYTNLYFNANLVGLDISKVNKLMMKFKVSDGLFTSESYCIVK